MEIIKSNKLDSKTLPIIAVKMKKTKEELAIIKAEKENKRQLKEANDLAKIIKDKSSIREIYLSTGKLPNNRSSKKLKNLYKEMEKFNDPDNYKKYDADFSRWLKESGFTSFKESNCTKTLKYRIYPSPYEERQILRQMELCRKIYNILIEERQVCSDKVDELKKNNPDYVHNYKNKDLYPDAFSQEAWLTKFRAKNPKLPIFEETSSSIRSKLCSQVEQA